MRSKSRGFVKALGRSRGHCIVSPGKHRPHPRTLTFWLQVPVPGNRHGHSLSLHCPGRREFPVSGLWLGARVFVVCLVAQSCLMLFDPVDCSLPGSSIHGDSPGKNSGVGCHALLQGIFPTQGSNPGLQYCRQILYHLSHQGNQKLINNNPLIFVLLHLSIPQSKSSLFP